MGNYGFFANASVPQYELNRRKNKPNYEGSTAGFFGDLMRKIQAGFSLPNSGLSVKKNATGEDISEIQKITGKTYDQLMQDSRQREDQLMNRQALLGGVSDYNKYQYLGGQAQMEAAKNIGRNTQDMLRTMAYGQAALSKAIAGASNMAPLDRKYFS
jgi:hypothetical protein